MEKKLSSWLKESDPKILEALWKKADQVRSQYVGNAVHLRGLVEISNHCTRACWYCGIRKQRKMLTRYRMNNDEIIQCIRKIIHYGYGTVVIQAGEDPKITPKDIIEIISWVKNNSNLAVTLSLGEQSNEVFRKWRRAGADRYLLRIETTDDVLLAKIHPEGSHGTRKNNILRLKELGFEVGSGVMVGIPGQTYDILEKDIDWFKAMDLDMIGIGPYIPHPDTPLANIETIFAEGQTNDSEILVNKVIALSRLTCPEANIPATTAIATINTQNGRETALCRGANVVMPNVTPSKYRILYEIYPGKSCVNETAEVCHECIKRRIKSIGREVGTGKGSRINVSR